MYLHFKFLCGDYCLSMLSCRMGYTILYILTKIEFIYIRKEERKEKKRKDCVITKMQLSFLLSILYICKPLRCTFKLISSLLS